MSGWTEKEIDILKRYYPIESATQVAQRLPNRERSAVLGKANRLGIIKTNRRKPSKPRC